MSGREQAMRWLARMAPLSRCGECHVARKARIRLRWAAGLLAAVVTRARQHGRRRSSHGGPAGAMAVILIARQSYRYFGGNHYGESDGDGDARLCADAAELARRSHAGDK